MVGANDIVLPSGDAVLAGSLETASGPALRRVLFLGDSLVQESFPTLAARLRGRGVQSEVLGGGGQSLMWHQADWLRQLGHAVAAFDPDVVVLESCCGNFKFGPPWSDANGRAVAPDTVEFWADWRALAADAGAIASSRGAAVLWALGPATHTNGWYGPIDGRIPTANHIYQSLAQCAPGAGTIDWRVIGGPGGTYRASLPDVSGHEVQIRNLDGLHFTPAGIGLQSVETLAALYRQWTVDHGRPGPWPGDCR